MEILVVVGILILLTGVLTSWEVGIFRQNNSLQNSLLADQDARSALRNLVATLRAATPSDTGAYALGAAASTSLTFFSDLNGDGLHEQIRYFTDGSNLNLGILKPTGSPLVYNQANEVVTTVVRDLVSFGPTRFNYYDDTYAGTTSPLAFPINIPSVRLVKITFAINKDPVRQLTPAIYQSQVTIRSLKDNL